MSLLFLTGQRRYGEVRVYSPVLLSVVPVAKFIEEGWGVHSVCQPTLVLCTNSCHIWTELHCRNCLLIA